MCTEARRARGFTLIEICMAIAIVGVALAGVIAVFVTTAQHSADPMVRQQAQFVAEAYLDEILRQRFYDGDEDLVCPAPEASRSLYDNVCDYRNIANEAPTNAMGAPIAGLAAYRVTVTVTRDGAVSLNGIDNATVVRVLRVDVTVTGPAGTALKLTGYRTNYNCNAAGEVGCKDL